MKQVELTAALAERALSIGRGGIPADVEQIARHCLLDWWAVALSGWKSPSVAPLLQRARELGATPVATLLGSGECVSLEDAAIVNGTASHVLDFDDAHLPSRVHPSVPLWPAIIALAEHRDLPLGRALAAFAAGVDLQSRLAFAMGERHYKLGWHNTATLGAFGATAAAACLWDLSQQQTQHALGIAATQAGGLRAAFGTDCKGLHAGRAAQLGLAAADLARRGMRCQEDMLERHDGYAIVTTGHLEAEAALKQLDRWPVREVVFKYHASCYGTQAPIEAALGVVSKGGAIGVDEDVHIQIQVEPQYMTVCNVADPVEATQAKFSIRHMVALVLAGRSTMAPESFTAAACADPVLHAMRRRIEVAPADDLPRANARLELRRQDGTVISVESDASKPESNLARQEQRLAGKAGVLIGHEFGRVRADAFLSNFSSLQPAQSVRACVRVLTHLLNEEPRHANATTKVLSSEGAM